MKDFIARHKAAAVAGLGSLAVLATPLTALAAEEGGTGVVTVITDAVSGFKSDALIVIGAGIGLGLVFWGAKMLWGKFKSMAK